MVLKMGQNKLRTKDFVYQLEIIVFICHQLIININNMND